MVIGEAEDLWPRFLADLEAGRPQPIYRCETPPSIARQPVPRWDLVDARRAEMHALVDTYYPKAGGTG